MKQVSACLPPRGRRRVGGRASGFTLVELLVVISIIAILLSILMPALGSVRVAARNVKCLSNLKQISVGWNSYMTEHKDYFPYSTGDNRRPNGSHHMFDWGGVNWYEGEFREYSAGRFYYGSTPSALVSPDRPVNPYLDADLEQKGANDVFECPVDTNVVNFGTNDAPYSFFSFSQVSPEGAFNLYEGLGTSYRANLWIWTRPWPEGRTVRDGTKTNNGRWDVRDVSRFILVGDYGPFISGRYPREIRSADAENGTGVVNGWWHGYERCNMAMLDGSAKQIQMIPGQGKGPDYTFWLDDYFHMPKSVLYPQARVWSVDPDDPEHEEDGG